MYRNQNQQNRYVNETSKEPRGLRNQHHRFEKKFLSPYNLSLNIPTPHNLMLITKTYFMRRNLLLSKRNVPLFFMSTLAYKESYFGMKF